MASAVWPSADRAWGNEAVDRYQFTPEKLEMIRGKLLWSHNDRLLLLGLLLEPLLERPLALDRVAGTVAWLEPLEETV